MVVRLYLCFSVSAVNNILVMVVKDTKTSEFGEVFGIMAMPINISV